MSGVERVLVVGGGIGGLSAAIALRKRELTVDVVEINPDWDVYGVGIIQPNNAIRALDDLGVAQQCLEQGFAMKGHVYLAADGSPLGPPFDHPALRPGLVGLNGITRPRLHKILQDATLASGASVRTGVSVEQLTDTGDAVDVTFSDGSTGRYDLVIGADGINSATRRMVFGDAAEPQYIGQVCWRYNVRRRPDVDRLTMFVGAYGKAGFVPLSDDVMYILLIEKPPDGAQLRLPTEGLAAEFRRRLAEYGGPVAEVRDTEIVDDDQVVYRPVETVMVPPPWYRGRVLLIGDAAHATSPHIGQGAAQAIEDAVVLAEELNGEGTLTDALDRFMARRFDRCRLVIESSTQISRWEQNPEAEMDFDGVAARASMAVAMPL